MPCTRTGIPLCFIPAGDGHVSAIRGGGKMAVRKSNKKPCVKKVIRKVWSHDSTWEVHFGELKRTAGNPGKTEHLFKVVAEKIPYEALGKIRADMRAHELPETGVYIAHDSMGSPRYIGRGNIFQRLEARKKAQKLELAYFSFYVVTEKKHEREIETLLIRAAGPMLEFNEKKKRIGIMPGAVKDFEPGTSFYIRRYQRGTKR